MAEERPAFTLEEAAPRSAELPVLAWVLANVGIGVTLGAFLGGGPCASGPVDPSCAHTPLAGALLVAPAALAGAALFAALPLPRSGDRALRITAIGAFGAAAGVFLIFSPIGRLLPMAAAALAIGLVAPCAMLTAIRPDAVLLPRRHDAKGPRRWLSVGAYPAGALAFGVGFGLYIPYLGALGPAFIALGGAALLALATMPPDRPAPDASKPTESRVSALFRMTPMLRHAAVADLGQAACFAAVATALVSDAWLASGVQGFRPGPEDTGVAVMIGALLGAALWWIWAPRADAAAGRGVLLTMGFAASALAPLALLGASADAHALGLLAASAWAAFALASAPQRHALLFDLASSRGRARTALDHQALKLAAAAGGALAFVGVESAMPGLGLPLFSALGFAALAAFAPTLGSLGRRAH